MLTELRITNFALIDRLSLHFSPGFHVLTGETGAGKSILVDALALLIGGRATVDLIRADADEATVEGAFTVPAGAASVQSLRKQGVLGEGDTELIIRRVLSRSGRHRTYLNGGLAPLQTLQRLAGTLVDIHGQHDEQSLLSSAVQLDALDAFGKLRPLRREYTEQYEQWCRRDTERQQAEREVQDRQAREDLIRFQYQELREAQLQAGEDDRLGRERQRLTHAERLSGLVNEVYGLLYEQDGSVLAALQHSVGCLKSAAEIDPAMQELLDLGEAASVQVRELAHRLRDARGGLEDDPERLGSLEERLDQLQRLKKKYGLSVDGLIAKRDTLHAEVEAMISSEDRLRLVRHHAEEALARLTMSARTLSDERRRVAAQFEKRVKKELAALRMERIQFKVDVRAEEGSPPGPTGWDQVAYLLSANPGEPPMVLSKVASGGELSRIMLALKTVLADTDRVPVLIFDEVDAGVGGAVATAMGQRLRALGQYHQVLCITHLPQIAAQADTHWLVEKHSDKKRTVTQVTRLGDLERREEVARMVGGLAVTPAVRKAAADMMSHGRS